MKVKSLKELEQDLEQANIQLKFWAEKLGFDDLKDWERKFYSNEVDNWETRRNNINAEINARKQYTRHAIK